MVYLIFKLPCLFYKRYINLNFLKNKILCKWQWKKKLNNKSKARKKDWKIGEASPSYLDLLLRYPHKFQGSPGLCHCWWGRKHPCQLPRRRKPCRADFPAARNDGERIARAVSNSSRCAFAKATLLAFATRYTSPHRER